MFQLGRAGCRSSRGGARHARLSGGGAWRDGVRPPSRNGHEPGTTGSFQRESLPVGGLLPPTADTPATLYSSAPQSVINQSVNPPSSSSLNSPQNNSTSSATNSPQKQPKTIPPQQQQQQQQAQTPSQVSGPASSPAVSSGGTTNTPAMSNTSLKRKQASDATSPAVGNPDQAPQKRVPRKRARGGTGGGP